MPTLGKALDEARMRLADADIPDAAIEARHLVRAALGITQTELLTRRKRELSIDEQATLANYLDRRAEHEPLQYIVGHAEFYGHRFHVDRRVLIPRPETELLVEQALEFIGRKQIEAPRIIDIGTGSGILAVTLAAEIRSATVTATDISEDAIAVARANAAEHEVGDRITFVTTSLATDVPGVFDIVVSNPPYVLRSALDSPEAQPELSYEPRAALDGGQAGMDVYGPLLDSLPEVLAPSGAAFIEIDPPVTSACVEIARRALPDRNVSVLTDLAGLDRCLCIQPE